MSKLSDKVSHGEATSIRAMGKAPHPMLDGSARWRDEVRATDVGWWVKKSDPEHVDDRESLDADLIKHADTPERQAYKKIKPARDWILSGHNGEGERDSASFRYGYADLGDEWGAVGDEPEAPVAEPEPVVVHPRRATPTPTALERLMAASANEYEALLQQERDRLARIARAEALKEQLALLAETYFPAWTGE